MFDGVGDTAPEQWINRETEATTCCMKTKHRGWKAGGGTRQREKDRKRRRKLERSHDADATIKC